MHAPRFERVGAVAVEPHAQDVVVSLLEPISVEHGREQRVSEPARRAGGNEFAAQGIPVFDNC